MGVSTGLSSACQKLQKELSIHFSLQASHGSSCSGWFSCPALPFTREHALFQNPLYKTTVLLINQLREGTWKAAELVIALVEMLKNKSHP